MNNTRDQELEKLLDESDRIVKVITKNINYKYYVDEKNSYLIESENELSDNFQSEMTLGNLTFPTVKNFLYYFLPLDVDECKRMQTMNVNDLEIFYNNSNERIKAAKYLEIYIEAIRSVCAYDESFKNLLKSTGTNKIIYRGKGDMIASSVENYDSYNMYGLALTTVRDELFHQDIQNQRIEMSENDDFVKLYMARCALEDALYSGGDLEKFIDKSLEEIITIADYKKILHDYDYERIKSSFNDKYKLFEIKNPNIIIHMLRKNYYFMNRETMNDLNRNLLFDIFINYILKKKYNLPKDLFEKAKNEEFCDLDESKKTFLIDNLEKLRNQKSLPKKVQNIYNKKAKSENKRLKLFKNSIQEYEDLVEQSKTYLKAMEDVEKNSLEENSENPIYMKYFKNTFQARENLKNYEIIIKYSTVPVTFEGSDEISEFNNLNLIFNRDFTTTDRNGTILEYKSIYHFFVHKYILFCLERFNKGLKQDDMYNEVYSKIFKFSNNPIGLNKILIDSENINFRNLNMRNLKDAYIIKFSDKRMKRILLKTGNKDLLCVCDNELFGSGKLFRKYDKIYFNGENISGKTLMRFRRRYLELGETADVDENEALIEWSNSRLSGLLRVIKILSPKFLSVHKVKCILNIFYRNCGYNSRNSNLDRILRDNLDKFFIDNYSETIKKGNEEKTIEEIFKPSKDIISSFINSQIENLMRVKEETKKDISTILEEYAKDVSTPFLDRNVKENEVFKTFSFGSDTAFDSSIINVLMLLCANVYEYRNQTKHANINIYTLTTDDVYDSCLILIGKNIVKDKVKHYFSKSINSVLNLKYTGEFDEVKKHILEEMVKIGNGADLDLAQAFMKCFYFIKENHNNSILINRIGYFEKILQKNNLMIKKPRDTYIELLSQKEDDGKKKSELSANAKEFRPAPQTNYRDILDQREIDEIDERDEREIIEENENLAVVEEENKNVKGNLYDYNPDIDFNDLNDYY